MTDWVRVEAEGALLERFVQRALSEGVRFSRIWRVDRRRMTLETDSSGAKTVLALLETYHMRGRVVGLSGRPALLKRLRARWTLLSGVLICAGLLAAYSAFVWRIDLRSVSGEAVAPEVQLALEEWGLTCPLRRQEVDAQLLRLRLLSRFPQYSYVGVRQRGAVLRIELASAEEAPEVRDLEAARDLVAARDGVVLRVTVLSGAAAVSPGDAVQKGQLLIRGEERVSKEETRGIRADGEVLARVWYEGECTLSLLDQEAEYTGRVSRQSRLEIGSWQWPLCEGEAFEHCTEETHETPLGGLLLPLKQVETTRREILLRQTRRAPEEAAADACAQALERAQAQLQPGEEEIDRWTGYTLAGDTLTARAVIEVQTQIQSAR